jgi:hypothetical protein
MGQESWSRVSGESVENCCDWSTGTVREPRRLRTPAGGSRHQRTHVDRADPGTAIVTWSYGFMYAINPVTNPDLVNNNNNNNYYYYYYYYCKNSITGLLRHIKLNTAKMKISRWIPFGFRRIGSTLPWHISWNHFHCYFLYPSCHNRSLKWIPLAQVGGGNWWALVNTVTT